MKVCIFGAGAIGGYLAVLLARAGADVSVIARGAHLDAIVEDGLTLLIDGEERLARPRCIEDPAEAGPQDYVIVTLKAHSISGVAERMQPLLGEDTAVVTAANGVPWWYFYGLSGAHENRRIESVDPGGRIWDAIGPERAIGCVVYPSAEIVEPGVVRHLSDHKMILGEPGGERSERVIALSSLFLGAGLKAPVRPRVRNEIWMKLWGNLAFNPLSALTCATLDVLATDPGTRGIARRMMLEAQQVGEALGVRFALDVDRRMEGAAAVGAHRTSMLQDLELGRPLETDAMVGAVQELAAMTAVNTPTIDLIGTLLDQRIAFR